MKVRVKFSKSGSVKFLGHLDTMRYFQKAVRRAGIPIAFSSGFRPHMIISFAAPLSVGVTSDGEYFDMELSEKMASRELVERFNGAMAPGFQVLSARKVPEGKKYNAMSMTAAADYEISLKGQPKIEKLAEKAEHFYSQPAIWAEKETKKGGKTVDLKPGIYQMTVKAGVCTMRLAASSANYVKPIMVLNAFSAYLGQNLDWDRCAVHRAEVYANEGSTEKPRFVPLDRLGENIE